MSAFVRSRGDGGTSCIFEEVLTFGIVDEVACELVVEYKSPYDTASE